MGEIADDLIDDMFDAMLLEDEWREDSYDTGVICKYCKGGPYHWKQDEYGNWRLYTEKTNQLHTCNKYKPKEVMHGNNS